MNLKMLSAKSLAFCLSLNVVNRTPETDLKEIAIKMEFFYSFYGNSTKEPLSPSITKEHNEVSQNRWSQKWPTIIMPKSLFF